MPSDLDVVETLRFVFVPRFPSSGCGHFAGCSVGFRVINPTCSCSRDVLDVAVAVVGAGDGGLCSLLLSWLYLAPPVAFIVVVAGDLFRRPHRRRTGRL